MDSNPEITVAFCVKNAEATVKEAIKSVLRQNYPHKLIDLIIVDGHSKDKTVAIIRATLSKSDVRYRIFYENEGLGYARQMAVDKARGQFIVWVDADLVLSHNYIQKLVELMKRNPSLGIAAGKFGMVRQGNLVAALENIDWVVGDYQKRKTLTPDPQRNCCAGAVFRISAIKQAGGFDSHIKGAGEDMDVGYRISKAGWSMYFGENALLLHKTRNTWKSIWDENFWYGYGGHYIMHKHKVTGSALSFAEVFQRPFVAYKLTGRKKSFLLPILFFFKKIAWLSGFLKAHRDKYGHE
ncbi:MAG: glycosyltransferase [Promethearchaeota archaeon]